MCVKHDFEVDKIKSAIKRLYDCQKKLKVILPNNGKYHELSEPVSSNYIFFSVDDIEMDSDDDDEPTVEKKNNYSNIQQENFINKKSSKSLSRVKKLIKTE